MPDMKLEHLLPVIVTRNRLEKWYGEPYWNKTVRGLFVRIQVGVNSHNSAIYKIAEITSTDRIPDCSPLTQSGTVDTNKAYRIGDKEFASNLIVELSAKSKPFEIKFVSNQAPSQEEFTDWLKMNHKGGGHIPTPNEILLLQAQIKLAQEYVYTEDDVTQKVNSFTSKKKDPINLAKTKLALEEELLRARNAGDEQRVEQVERDLADFTQLVKEEAQRETSEAASMLSEINKKRQLDYSKNLDQTREQVLLHQQEELEGKGGDSEDPFARRKTSVNFAFLKKPMEGKTEEAPLPTEPAPQGEEGGEHNLAPVDLRDLDPAAPSSTPSTPRTPARLVAAHKITPGGKPSKVLSLDEYKKTRGM